MNANQPHRERKPQTRQTHSAHIIGSASLRPVSDGRAVFLTPFSFFGAPMGPPSRNPNDLRFATQPGDS
ncbi:MAG TPA: hypothetical protein DCG12_03755 [Planctomycetaceae bacterium]|nr:hypothetical protein [Planctomycetaceae bacterium]